MYEELDTPEFNAAFWSWFDQLPLDNRKRFWYYTLDLAKIFFYNKVWKFSKGDVS